MTSTAHHRLMAMSVAAAAVVIGLANVTWPRASRPAPPAAPAGAAVSDINWSQAASCLVERWNPYNQTLGEMGRVVRFCATTYQGLER